jgi:hypothetical protein
LHDSSDEPFIYPLFASLLPHDADALAAKEQALHHAPPANGRRSRRPSCEISRAHSDITGCREVHAPPIERSASMPAECTAVSQRSRRSRALSAWCGPESVLQGLCDPSNYASESCQVKYRLRLLSAS